MTVTSCCYASYLSTLQFASPCYACLTGAMGRKRKGIEISGEETNTQEERTLIERQHRTKGGRLVSDFFWSLLGQQQQPEATETESTDVGAMDVDTGGLESQDILCDDTTEATSPGDFRTYEHDLSKIADEKREARSKLNQEQKKVDCLIMFLI